MSLLMIRALICNLGKLLFVFRKRQPPLSMKKVGIMRVGALGDVLMTTPLVRALKKKACTVHYYVGSSYHAALMGNPNIDRIIAFQNSVLFGRSRNIWNALKIVYRLVKHIRSEQYDCLYVLDKHWMWGIIGWLSCTYRVGFDRHGEGFMHNAAVPYTQKTHDIYAYLSLLKGTTNTIDTTDTKETKETKETKKHDTAMDFYIPPNMSESVKKDLEQYFPHNRVIAVVPGGGKNPGQDLAIKRWPIECYLALVEELVKNDYEVILIGGPEDVDGGNFIYENINKQCKTKVYNLIGTKSLVESAAYLKEVHCVICNDSGPMHLGAAVNNKIISLFGPTDPRVLAPLHKKAIYLWNMDHVCYDIYGSSKQCTGEEIKMIMVGDVMGAVKKYETNN